MPARPRHPCSVGGCGRLTKTTCCPAHTTQRHRERRQWRGSTTARGYGHDWQKLRKLKVQADPLCEVCLRHGRVVLTEEVDHIIPVEERPDLRLDLGNLQSLCGPCHTAKTEADKAARRHHG